MIAWSGRWMSFRPTIECVGYALFLLALILGAALVQFVLLAN